MAWTPIERRNLIIVKYVMNTKNAIVILIISLFFLNFFFEFLELIKHGFFEYDLHGRGRIMLIMAMPSIMGLFFCGCKKHALGLLAVSVCVLLSLFGLLYVAWFGASMHTGLVVILLYYVQTGVMTAVHALYWLCNRDEFSKSVTIALDKFGNVLRNGKL